MTAIGPNSTVGEVLAALEGVWAEPSVAGRLAGILPTLWNYAPDLIWLGAYLVERPGVSLALGPYLGPPGPARIGWREGVVGSCAYERAVQIVEDVSRFEGYIRAVADTASELAVPVVRAGRPLAVLDIQSPVKDGFDIIRVELMTRIAERLAETWPSETTADARRDGAG